MLHAVTLYYLCPEEDLSKQLDAHKKWLINGFNAGMIIFAGPLTNGDGGYILFHSEDVNNVYTCLEEDPFVKDKLVSVNVLSISPALTSHHFPEKWSGQAKVIQ